LDPFSGSFSTCNVAKKFKRKSIGIELNLEYIKIGLRKLNIDSNFSAQELEKIKKRKTNNKSKKDHFENLDLNF